MRFPRKWQPIWQPIFPQTCLLIIYKFLIRSHIDNSNVIFDQTSNASFAYKIEVSAI